MILRALSWIKHGLEQFKQNGRRHKWLIAMHLNDKPWSVLSQNTQIKITPFSLKNEKKVIDYFNAHKTKIVRKLIVKFSTT